MILLLLKKKIVQITTENDVKQKYEERITELHSVIAELARKLQVQRTQVITEEIEESQSGFYFLYKLLYKLILRWFILFRIRCTKH